MCVLERERERDIVKDESLCMLAAGLLGSISFPLTFSFRDKPFDFFVVLYRTLTLKFTLAGTQVTWPARAAQCVSEAHVQPAVNE